MKASEYFAEHRKKLVKDDYDINKLIKETGSEEEAAKKYDEWIREGLNGLINAMNAEVKEICAKRKCKTDSATAAVIREMNDRWNAMIPMFEKYYDGRCPLKRNGFAKFWINEIPSLSRYIKI